MSQPQPQLRTSIKLLIEYIHDLEPQKFLFDGRLLLPNPDGKPFVVRFDGEVIEGEYQLQDVLDSILAVYDTLWGTPSPKAA